MTRTNIDKLLLEAARYRIQEYPHVSTYYRNPSLKNAEALLDAFGLHVPFRTYTNVKMNHKAVSLPILQEKTKMRRTMVTSHGGATVAFQKKLSILAHIDFLHDIHSVGPGRIDVAIQRNALYLTIDRIAHMYYSLRCKEKQVESRGIYYFPKDFACTEIVTEM